MGQWLDGKLNGSFFVDKNRGVDIPRGGAGAGVEALLLGGPPHVVHGLLATI